jgi:ribosome biogenesis GTPase
MDMYTNQGVVFRKSTGIYHINADDGKVVACTISSRLRKKLIYPDRDPSSLGYFKVVDVEDIELVDPVAVGDVVAFTDAGDGSGMITEIEPRRSQLTRRAPGSKPLEQVIVANVDQVVTVFASAQPKPKWNMLDRYLAGAETSNVPVIIVLNKHDLVRGRKAESELSAIMDAYRKIGYTVLFTCAQDGTGVDTLRHLLADKLSAFIGMSGVGKTTLLNAVQPGLGLAIGRINVRIDKGRHTTTQLEMFPLEGGGHIVDTPGMKVFGLWQVEPEDIDDLYREFGPYLGRCKFGASCTHDHEPECAVKQAVGDGQISQRRYDSYLYLRQYIYAET